MHLVATMNIDGVCCARKAEVLCTCRLPRSSVSVERKIRNGYADASEFLFVFLKTGCVALPHPIKTFSHQGLLRCACCVAQR